MHRLWQRFGVVLTVLLQAGDLLVLTVTMTLNPHIRKMRIPSSYVN